MTSVTTLTDAKITRWSHIRQRVSRSFCFRHSAQTIQIIPINANCLIVIKKERKPTQCKQSKVFSCKRSSSLTLKIYLLIIGNHLSVWCQRKAKMKLNLILLKALLDVFLIVKLFRSMSTFTIGPIKAARIISRTGHPLLTLKCLPTC